jgi:hypothetical protein
MYVILWTAISVATVAIAGVFVKCYEIARILLKTVEGKED